MADIVFVTSGVGGGKSLWGTRAILRELRDSERCVVTNVPLYLVPEFTPPGYLTVGEWCHKYVRDKEVDVNRRLRILQKGEMYDFYRFYPCCDLPWVDVERPAIGSRGLRRGGVVEVADLGLRQDMQADGELPVGCLFVLDEVHLFFGARDWADAGPGVQHYMSQMRKLNDDVLLLSQHPEKVDKNFRRDATEFVVMQNLEKTRLFGGVSFKGQFNVHTYSSLPGRGDKPITTQRIDLDCDQMCFVYNTMAGVGLSARVGPELKRWKGRNPYLVWPLLLVVFCAAAIVIPRMFLQGSSWVARVGLHSFGGVMGRQIASVAPGHVHPGSDEVSVAPVAANPLAGARIPVLPTFVGVGQVEPRFDSNVFVAGISSVGADVCIYLTDGRHIAGSDRRVRHVDSEYVDINGTRYHWVSASVDSHKGVLAVGVPPL